jgi:hypothetical protein
MINGWLSLRVRNPKDVAEWYQKLGFEIVGAQPEIGTLVVGTKEERTNHGPDPGGTTRHP